MIRPPGLTAGVYTSDEDGDQRSEANWRAVAEAIGAPVARATLTQVHGGSVAYATEPGGQGQADALFTDVVDLSLVVLIADCLAVIVEAEDHVGVAHAGWRGLQAGVVANLTAAMCAQGASPIRAAIGPAIGACCFEVGPEVADLHDERFLRSTTWGTVSVDLSAIAMHQLGVIPVDEVGECTRCGRGGFSHRGTGTKERLAGVVWLPADAQDNGS